MPSQGGYIYNLHLTAEQLEFRDTIRTFVRDEVKPVATRSLRLEPFAKPLLKEQLDAASAMGLRALMLSDANGGAGADNLSACIVAEDLAQGDADIAVVISHTAVLARVLFDDLMSAEQHARHLPRFAGDNAFHLAYAGCDTRAGLQADYHRPSGAASAGASAAKNAKGDWVSDVRHHFFKAGDTACERTQHGFAWLVRVGDGCANGIAGA